MRKIIALVAAIAVATVVTSVTALGRDSSRRGTRAKVTTVSDLWFELVGQFQNSAPGVTPETHIHYGYISWIRGVSAFGAAPQTEASAKFTFFADGKTSAVTSNGPLR